jgi:4-amino-4-deoxy-L-arabinose transferase-like glycosyltransferase
LSTLILLAYGALFCLIAFQHARYPGFLEPMEGDILAHIERLAQGGAVYPAPGAEFIGLAHMPLYYLVSVPLYWLFGPSLIGPRLVSSLCALVTAFLLGKSAARESGSRETGYLAAGFFFSSYRILDTYVTVALPDMLALFCIVLGFWFFAYGTTAVHDIAWLLCFTLAFWTKQHGAIIFALALAYALVLRRNALPRWALLAGFVLGVPVAYFLLGPLFGERFFFYTFEMPAHWIHRAKFSVTRTAFLLACFVPALCLLAYPFFRRAVSWREKRLSPLAWFVLASLASAAYTMTAAGSSNNHYIPFVSFLIVAAAVGAKSLLDETPPAFVWLFGAATVATAIVMLDAKSRHSSIDLPTHVPLVMAAAFAVYLALRFFVRRLEIRGVAIAGVLIACHLGVVWLNPLRLLPPSDTQETLARVRIEVAKIDGPLIYASYGNAPPELFGKKLQRAPSWVALDDIARQQLPREQIEPDLAPFLSRIRSAPDLYVLSDHPLDEYPVWYSVAGSFVLLRDFGREFSSLRQLALPWYAKESFPRYLYRKRLE